ncbi:hypothetical protein OAK85_00100 [Mariniblastus sp.]|jgi:hypothetical protein|nr:hypothetical protein [bacterium]MDB4371419.1 hypothetical protein [Mariniblastus sp.]MDC0283726.1 hypothetical protein [Mariniblastus sp.]MDC3255893.1 hypothetical protein [bacterium]
MKDSIRKNRLLVDWKFQGALCLRISFYWLLCQTTLVATMLGFLALEAQADLHPYDGTASPWRFIMPAVVGSSVFLPLVLLDNLRMSNRIAQTLNRFRNTLNQLCERQESESVVDMAADRVSERNDASKSVVSS